MPNDEVRTVKFHTPYVGGHAGNVTTHATYDGDVPAGAVTFARGIEIRWQNGPLRGADGLILSPNGAFVEDVLASCVHRLQHFQGSRFACDENSQALDHIAQAIAALEARTARRTIAGTEGTTEGA